MIKTVIIRGLEIGTDMPKIVVPIVEKTRSAILEKAKSFKDLRIDLVEWRADFYDDALKLDHVLATLVELRTALIERPLLFTFRTKREGGEKEIDMDAYTALNKVVAWSGNADMVDVELFSGDETVKRNIANIHEAKVPIVGSSHDFHSTPDKAELVSRLRRMQELDMDIPKMAVMPTNTQDVLTLLSASSKMHETYADRPIVTMAMGPLGVISRLSGEVFGSALTFGSVGHVSAPGQIPVVELADVLDILHRSLHQP